MKKSESIKNFLKVFLLLIGAELIEGLLFVFGIKWFVKPIMGFIFFTIFLAGVSFGVVKLTEKWA